MARNKLTRGLLLTFTLALVLSGCGGSNNSNAANSEGRSGSGEDTPVILNLMHLWSEASSAQQNKLVSQIIDDYQKEHPNVIIRQEVLENEQYKNKLRVLSASNRLPDIGFTWAAGFMEPYVKGGLFAPLNDILDGEELKDKFVGGTIEPFTVDGKTYALPIEFYISPIYYNKDIFAKYNLQVPVTYEQLKQVVKTLSGTGIAPIALGNKDRWTGSLWYMYLADRIAGSDALKKAADGTGSYMDPGLIQAAVEVQKLVDMNAFSRGFNGLSNEESKADFMNEKAAMYLTGTWELPNFTTNPEVTQEFKDKVGFFKFPTVEGGKGAFNSWIGGPGVGLFVAESSRQKKEAKAFVEYFVSKWGQESVTTAGVIPATRVDTANIHLPQLYVDLLNERKYANNATLNADVLMKPAAAQVYLNMIQALFGEAVTPDQFINRQKETVEKEY